MANVTFTSIPPEHVYWNVTNAGIGPLLVGFTVDKQLCRLTFLAKRKAAAVVKEWRKEWPHTTFSEKPKTPRALGPEAPILLVGTDFQHRVWSALLDIPSGQTVTYGELAARIGRPKAARAVGTALGANPVPLFVPCHRVVASNGLGGFTGGLAIKKRLLTTEKV